MQEINIYLNNTYMCWLDKSFASKQEVLEIVNICPGMFKTNEDGFSNYIFSVIIF
jgi:hypothetical protein